MDIDARAFGQLEGKVEALGATLETQNGTLAAQNLKMDAISAKMDAIGATLSEARGGWKMLLLVGGSGAAVATAVTWVLQHLGWKVGG